MGFRDSRPTNGATAAPAQSFYGFTKDGSCFRSDTRVENAMTDFVRRAIVWVRDRKMPPAEVVLQIRNEGEDVRALFVPIAGQWALFDRFRQWPHAYAGNSVLQTIKMQGKGKAPWDDEAAWAWACDASEAERGQVRETVDPATATKVVADRLRVLTQR